LFSFASIFYNHKLVNHTQEKMTDRTILFSFTSELCSAFVPRSNARTRRDHVINPGVK